MRRLLIIAITASVVLIAIAYPAYWFYASSAIKSEAQNWFIDRNAEGYEALHGDISVGGFPGAFKLDIEGVAMGSPAGDWTAATSRVSAASGGPFDLESWRVIIEGDVLTQFAADGSPAEVTLGGLELLVQTTNGGISGLTAQIVSADIAYDEPQPLLTAFGKRMDDIYIVLNTDSETPEVTIIDRATLRWGAADLSAIGRVGIDDRGYLTGQTDLGLNDPDMLVSALQDAGILGRQESQFVQVALTLAPRDEEGRVLLPLSFVEGRAFLGPAPIGEAPRLYVPDTNS